MTSYNTHLLDLPNEMLFLILSKLNNVDVLYSFFGINNQRLETIAQDQTFTTMLNFVYTSTSNDDKSSISNAILDRYYSNILSKISYNIRHIILDSSSIERILYVGTYPNLTNLKLYNFNRSVLSIYFQNDSLFRYISKEQITELTLIFNENFGDEENLEEYTINVYLVLFNLFINLKHLSFSSTSIYDYPSLSLYNMPPTNFSSSTLTKLRLDVLYFDDCLALLDGRLKQLCTCLLQVRFIGDQLSMFYNTDDLPYLKSFSLKSYNTTSQYDNLVVPLLHRMPNLEDLTLYICIKNRSTFVDGIDIHNDILVHMKQLHTFTFYISTENAIDESTIRLSNNDIQQTFIHRLNQQVACNVEYVRNRIALCHVFSLPFTFDHLRKITHNFLSTMTFNSVTNLMLWDNCSFEHEFFVRVARCFPSLKYLCINNIWPSSLRMRKPFSMDDYSPIVEYPHLISLDISFTNMHYIDQFLNENITKLPRLTELKIIYPILQEITENFTRSETKRNCLNVKRLIFAYDSGVFSEDVYRYFPSL